MVVKGPMREVASVMVVLGGMEACGERDWGCAKGCGGDKVAR